MKETIRIILDKVKNGALSVDEGTTILSSMISAGPARSEPVSTSQSSSVASASSTERTDMEDIFRQVGMDPGSSKEAAGEIDRILKETLGKLQG